MGITTGIEWTNSTFNPWIGCTNISPGCDHCYAEQQNAYRGWSEWGAHGTRKRTSASNWQNPIKWNKAAKAFQRENGHRQRVFCASLADVFDNKAPEEFRSDLFELIRSTPELDWQLLTKRPQNIRKMLPSDWDGGYHNVWLGTTCEDQIRYDQRWQVLRDIPAAVRFISYEPAIGGVRLHQTGVQPDWLISGGESGHHARVMNPQWARDIIKDCKNHGVAVFHKQWGQYASNPLVFEQGLPSREAESLDPKSNGKGGGLLDGELYREFPAPRSVALAA